MQIQHIIFAFLHFFFNAQVCCNKEALTQYFVKFQFAYSAAVWLAIEYDISLLFNELKLSKSRK